MNWKKKLATYASLTVLATFIIHIINKLTINEQVRDFA